MTRAQLHCGGQCSFLPKGVFFLLALFLSSAPAQITFNAYDIPDQTGIYYRAFVNTSSVSISSGWLGTNGGPIRWDFSQTQAVNEAFLHMDVVPTTDGGQSASFPSAGFAERLTYESSGGQSWSY